MIIAPSFLILLPLLIHRLTAVAVKITLMIAIWNQITYVHVKHTTTINYPQQYKEKKKEIRYPVHRLHQPII
ncbi:hypothetical protein BJ944DRAFT_271406 [Cunninghamella echinulata]|nr:hypothetical protein BJ944DRAFT_271406 [Cunninghamella echinulata]